MKKIIFSVFVIGFASASLFGAEKENKLANSKEKNPTTCQIVTQVTVKDSRQHIIERYDVCTEGSGDQCKGAVNGQVFRQQTIRVAGIEPSY